MKLTQLKLENFRNYSKTEVAINSDLVLILGPNAAGKTNLLEGIYYLSELCSFRSPDQLLVKSPESHFRLACSTSDKAYEVIVQTNPVLKRLFKTDGQKVKRRFWKSFTNVLFLPSDLNLFSLGPAPRRKYLDDTLSQMKKDYVADLISLDHVLTQRKNLLQQIFEGRAKKEELAFWNEQLIALTQRIGKARQEFLDFLNENLAKVYSKLTNFTSGFAINYKTAATANLASELDLHYSAELRLGQNLVGPHREDFSIEKDGLLNIHNSSRGELRAQILAIKLLQAQYLDGHNMPPIILLDDVFSELDEERRSQLIENLSGHQIFITTTEEHHLPEMRGAQVLKIENGEIV